MDTRSLDEEIDDPFALLKLQVKVWKVDSKVDTTTTKVASFDLKLDLVFQSLSEIKADAPSKIYSANKLDQLISLLLKRTLEEAEEKYKDNLDHHISTTLKIHDDMIFATNELIKQTHVHHEK